MKRFTVAALAALALSITGASASSMSATRQHVRVLQQRVAWFHTTIVQDEQAIKNGYEWVAIGPHVEQLVQHVQVDDRRAHLLRATRLLHIAAVTLKSEQAKLAKITLAAQQPSLPWAFWNCVASGWTGGTPGRGSHVSVGEGGATSYNPAGPYYGRYQADSTFIRAHGGKEIAKYGNADPRTWSVTDQTVMAEAGFVSQGQWAWPNTAPPCVFLRGHG